ncbi:zinc finger FYVE domain-containing protein 21-like [Corticium candelabrum]|uniref:zinc finger FYVE domain-containing protein 21-like n=1 Tax=Corticium candelabrum TaxID=121492 RepID=UPI002E26D17F|nr:zinc finger FYVE domain-containing protein 21-like [Corticium candelabrum]
MAKRLVRGKGGLRMISVDGHGSIFDLAEPSWDEDSKHPSCSNPDCAAQFNVLHRRHHCRVCGKVFCGNCCDHKQPVLRMGLVDPVRLCQHCESEVKKDNIFCSKHLKVLTTGAKFTLAEVIGVEFVCRLSDDHSEILFGGASVDSRDPINLKGIIEVINIENEQLPTQERGSFSSEVCGLVLVYRPPHSKEEVSIQLKIVEQEDKAKHGKEWLLALKKALTILHRKK